MSAKIYIMPRTPVGRLEMVCARRTGKALDGVDWDAAGRASYAAYLQRMNDQQPENIVALRPREPSGNGAA